MASFNLNDGVTGADGGTITFHTSQAAADAGTGGRLSRGTPAPGAPSLTTGAPVPARDAADRVDLASYNFV